MDLRKGGTVKDNVTVFKLVTDGLCVALVHLVFTASFLFKVKYQFWPFEVWQTFCGSEMCIDFVINIKNCVWGGPYCAVVLSIHILLLETVSISHTGLGLQCPEC